MRLLVILVFGLSAICGSAEIVETTGYGSGDDIAQALVAAKVDAILNAGGRTSVSSEAKRDQLLKDEGKSENEASLVSYEVTEKGESFDGTYVRIKAKVSKAEDYVLKDGKTIVRGEGSGKTEREAMVMAMCNAVVESGAKIKAVVKYENEQLVADDAQVEAHGVLASCEREKGVGGENIKVNCRIYPDSDGFSALLPTNVVGEGTGKNASAAENKARREMVLSCGSELHVHSTYKDGTMKSFTAERRCDAFISASMAANVSNDGGPGVKVRVEGTMYGDAGRLAMESPKTEDGVGHGSDVVSAHNAAMCDALVNLGSHVKLSVFYDRGRQTKESATYRSSYNYFGEELRDCSAADGGCLVQTQVRAGGSLPDVDAGISESVVAIGVGKGKSDAVKDAKQRAVDMVFGSPVVVCVSERDGVITDSSWSASHSEKGYVDDYELISEEESVGGSIVRIRAVVKNHDGDTVGWGWITATIVLVVMLFVFVVVKQKTGVVGLTIVWILAALGLFASGHWAVGIMAILFGIGATKAD